MKRCLENSARFMPDVERFAQGYGLLQVENAFSYLTNYFACSARDVRFTVSCGNTAGKGILVRSTPLHHPLLYNVNIEPSFRDSDDVSVESKIAFSLHIALVTKDSFVQAPKYLELQNQIRSFSIKIDPTHLTPGVHYTSIEGYDTSCPEKGALFSIPITVIQPFKFQSEDLPYLEWKKVTFKPNTIQRHFIYVPGHATWGVLKLRCNKVGEQARYLIHCMQILPKKSCKCQEYQKIVTVTSQNETVLNFQVKGGVIMEMVVAKYWANLGEIEIDYSLSIYGVKPDSTNITMQAADGIYSVDVKTLRSEEIMPAVNLKASVQILR